MSESVILAATPTNALLEDSEPNCLVEFIYVFPQGEIPEHINRSEIPDDYDAVNSHFEDYQHEWSQVPKIGDTREWRSLEWNVTAVYPYLSDDEAKVYIAVCNQSTSVPNRNDWNGQRPLLYIPVLLGGEIATNDDGSSHFGMCDRHADIPTKAIFEDWEFADWQRFHPIGPVAPQEYREIVLCWCVREPAIIAA